MENKLPSAWQIHEIVDIDLFASGKIKGAEIIAVHFTKSKITYDLAVITVREAKGDEETGTSPQEEQWTIISDVDSAMICRDPK